MTVFCGFVGCSLRTPHHHRALHAGSPHTKVVYDDLIVRAAPSAALNGVVPAIDGGALREGLAGGKLRLELIPPQTTAAIANVLGFGAKKYAPNNWMRGMSWSQATASVERHLQAFKQGDETDAESQLPHLAHALCSLMFLHFYAHSGRNYTAFDDRQFKNEEPL